MSPVLPADDAEVLLVRPDGAADGLGGGGHGPRQQVPKHRHPGKHNHLDPLLYPGPGWSVGETIGSSSTPATCSTTWPGGSSVRLVTYTGDIHTPIHPGNGENKKNVVLAQLVP